MLPAADIFAIVRWYGVLWLVGVVFWLLTRQYFKAHQSLHYAISKGVGLVALAAFSWLFSTLYIIPFSSLYLWIIILIAFLIALKNTNKKLLIKDIKARKKRLLLIEIFVFSLFMTMTTIRANNPRAEGVEKFMDIGIVQSLMRTEKGVPEDQYYAGKKINYYYFGHYIVTTVAKLAHVDGARAFNLGSATTVAIAGVSIAAAAYVLSGSVSGALLAVFLALFLSNLHPFLAMLRGEQNYQFFNSGRFMEQLINEYPFYSVSLGDLHAHFLSLMITTPLIYFGSLYMRFKKRSLLLLAIMGFGLGLLAPTNAFDVISIGVFLGLVLLVTHGFKTALLRSGAIVGLAAALPVGVFMLHFVSPDGGVGIGLWKTPTSHVFMQFGGFFVLILLAGALYAWKHKPMRDDYRARLKSILAVLVAGIGVMLLVQVGFLKDIYYYQNPPFSRANTEFKLWYTAWIILAVGSASVAVYAHKIARKGVVSRLYWCMIFILVGMLSAGTFYGLQTVQDDQPNTIDSLAFLDAAEADKLATVRWANQSIIGQKHILEAVGDSYSRLNWLSAYTGLPTIMGWRSHEWGWRYTANEWPVIAGRQGDVEQLYQSSDTVQLKQKVRQENLDYILVGPDERLAYRLNEDVFTAAYGQPVFTSGTYHVYKVSSK